MDRMQNLKEALAFGITLGELVEGIVDGLDLEDLNTAIAAIHLAGPAMKEIGEIGEEVMNLTEADRKELKEFVESELDLYNDNLEGVIEAALRVVVDLTPLLKLLKP